MHPVARTREVQFSRAGFTLVEVLVVIGIIALLMAIVLPAVQQARFAARRVECLNRMRQIGLAIHAFESDHTRFPPGKSNVTTDPAHLELSWLAYLLPWLEQAPLWHDSMEAYRYNRLPYSNPPHTPFGKAVAPFQCPLDSRVAQPQLAPSIGNRFVGLTSYIGVSGIDRFDTAGILYFGSTTRFGDITDGTSNTLVFGERPPSSDYNFGWWYTGAGQDGTGNVDLFMGVSEVANETHSYVGPKGCAGRYHFKAATIDDPCAFLHFWSLHPGGAHFALADGSVRFFSYHASSVIEKLATRAGGEIIGEF
jgi:prepilin-type N-terminal cleavage/methylation domain-containing protein/prepilin-type processing-associated H-X9-DG protein